MNQPKQPKGTCVECQKQFPEMELENKFTPIILCKACYQNMVDYELNMRKHLEPDDFQFIIDNVYLGSENSGFDLKALHDEGIHHLLVVAHVPYLKFKERKDVFYKGHTRNINSKNRCFQILIIEISHSLKI